MNTNILLRAGAGVAVAGMLAAVAAGCGGSSSTSGSAAATESTSTNTNSNTNAAAFSKYQSCLQSHGVTFPRRGNGSGGPPQGGFQPGGGGGQGAPPSGAPPQAGNGQGGPPGGFGLSPAQQQKFQAAQQACAKDLPAGARNGGGFFGGGRGGGANSQAFAAFRNCLKLHGVTLSQGFRPSGSSTQSAKVRKAMSACAALRPSPSGGGGAPPTTTTTG